MFQIKTDIRQYNCETREKVEKLIRNWVIRPSDLIYNDDEGEWNPIGQHPSFDELFRELDEEESRVPDTVVTSDRPSGDDEDGGEVTQITESPLDDEDDEDAPRPPEPSEDVEGVIRDSDEITMMTDKTLDMMRLDDEGSEAEEADRGDEESTDVVERDEVADEDEDTDVVERDEVTEKDEDTDVVERDDVEGSPEEPTQLIDREDVDGSPDEESTNVVDRDEVEGDEDDHGEASIVVDEDALEEDEDAESGEGGGRHGLPEDVFVTNEIPAQSAEDSVLDELGELDEDDEDFDLDEGLSEASDDAETQPEQADEESGERRAKWRIVMSEDEDDVDAEWENVAEEIRDTDEFSKEEIESTISEDRDEPQESLDFDEDDDEDEVPDESVAADEQADDEPDEDVDEDELEEVAVEAVEGESEDDDDLDGLLDDAAELVGVNARDPDAEGSAGSAREPIETPVGQTTDPAFVSEGYKMDLPIDVGPSEEDLEFGVPRATVDEETKAETFPYPRPKHPGKVIVRRFGLGEELADDDDMADDLPDAGEHDVDPLAETKPVEDEAETRPVETRVSTPSTKRSTSTRATKDDQPKDQSALIVIILLATFIVALILAVYFLG